MFIRITLYVVATLLSSVVSAGAATMVFENDLGGWQALASPESIIDFERASGELVGDEFSGLTLSPQFELVSGVGLFAGDLAPTQITPSSGVNVFAPASSGSIEGIIRLSFDSPVRAVGAFFFDVEADFALTGFSTVAGNQSPDVTFSSFQGQSVQSFLGFVTDSPISVVDIHFATGPNIDGTVIDDLRYSAVPEPSTALLLGLGLLGLNAQRRPTSACS